jgi:RES domain
LFFAESPQTPWPVNATEYTAFMVAFKTAAALDLTMPPLDRNRVWWTSRTDYRACQDLAHQARTAGIDALRYESVRDRKGGHNLALLACRVFASREPVQRQTWRIHLGSGGVRAVCEFPDLRMAFDRGAFADDPRIGRMRWVR